MKRAATASAPARVLLSLLVLGAVLVLLAGCTTTTPAGGQGSQEVVGVAAAPTDLQSKMVHVAGSNRGVILLVEMSTCPHCASTLALLDKLGVDYWSIDLNTLNQTEITEVFDAVNPMCGTGETVPRLVIRGQQCIVGDQQDKIREAVG